MVSRARRCVRQRVGLGVEFIELRKLCEFISAYPEDHQRRHTCPSLPERCQSSTKKMVLTNIESELYHLRELERRNIKYRVQIDPRYPDNYKG